ncbi:Glutaminyl-tRNA synthetase [Croceitalea dokdonensis DOKDO 023]|uniref:Glutaminyl-tRNA synthetase n=1 Tax=Croceitalea dokdonensis DOKDO 023 TaxID=1300341 RepID=A0A0P7AUG1_9FLAO|nr:DUF6327 family protein [Croceitalea dokdonensis]KPM32136.1 Glutaminyl-tRNA synthetase [Croceitalea dokdonensis DOKDO 023]
MKKKQYTSLEEIKLDLQVLQLQRKIQMEELKSTRHQFKEDLSPANWIGTLLKGVKKYGVLLLLKKIIK